MAWFKLKKRRLRTAKELVDSLSRDYDLDEKACVSLEAALYNLLLVGCPIKAVEDAIRDIFDNVCQEDTNDSD